MFETEVVVAYPGWQQVIGAGWLADDGRVEAGCHLAIPGPEDLAACELIERALHCTGLVGVLHTHRKAPPGWAVVLRSIVAPSMPPM